MLAAVSQNGAQDFCREVLNRLSFPQPFHLDTETLPLFLGHFPGSKWVLPHPVGPQRTTHEFAAAYQSGMATHAVDAVGADRL